MSFIESEIETDVEVRANPVDLVEKLASLNDWSFERSGVHELTLVIAGRWAEYHASFQWMDELEAFHIACAFDLKIPEARRHEALKLMAIINEQLWLGHFDLWLDDGVVMYRHALPLAGGAIHERTPMRGAAVVRHRGDRALLPGLPVRGLGRQARARGHRRHPVRDRRRGVT